MDSRHADSGASGEGCPWFRTSTGLVKPIIGKTIVVLGNVSGIDEEKGMTGWVVEAEEPVALPPQHVDHASHRGPGS